MATIMKITPKLSNDLVGSDAVSNKKLPLRNTAERGAAVKVAPEINITKPERLSSEMFKFLSQEARPKRTILGGAEQGVLANKDSGSVQRQSPKIDAVKDESITDSSNRDSAEIAPVEPKVYDPINREVAVGTPDIRLFGKRRAVVAGDGPNSKAFFDEAQLRVQNAGGRRVEEEALRYTVSKLNEGSDNDKALTIGALKLLGDVLFRKVK
jgi:hypothetical protein